MNGPEVIEQEAGIAEMDASDRVTIWSLMGGEQRYATGLADALIEDDVDAIVACVRRVAQRPVDDPRSADVDSLISRLTTIDAEHPPEPRALRLLWSRGAT